MLTAKALRNLIKGSTKTAVFAITTRCNCRCFMCDMHRRRPEQIGVEQARKVLDFLAANRFMMVYFTGGEPTLHPELLQMVRYANELGLVTTMTTNGTSSKSLLSALKEAGLDVLSVSLDHWSPDICEEIRGYAGIMSKQTEIIRHCRRIGMRVYALAYLNPYVATEGVENLVEYVREALGVPFGFCYPTKSGVNSYRLGGKLSEDDLNRGMRRTMDTLLSMKRKRSNIANCGTYIEDVIRFIEARAPKFYCKGGEDVVYIDWHGDVYPCFLKERLFNIPNGETPRFLKDVRCSECVTNCFREPSLLPHLMSRRFLLNEFRYPPSLSIFV